MIIDDFDSSYTYLLKYQKITSLHFAWRFSFSMRRHNFCLKPKYGWIHDFVWSHMVWNESRESAFRDCARYDNYSLSCSYRDTEILFLLFYVFWKNTHQCTWKNIWCFYLRLRAVWNNILLYSYLARMQISIF